MPWFKVDDGFHSHPKVIDLSLEAIGAWTLAGAWCAQYLTDGHITPKQLAKAGGDPEHAEQLVAAGLWEETETGWQFANWTEYQPTKDKVEADREAWAERQRKARERKRSRSDSTARSQGESTSESQEESRRDSRVNHEGSHGPVTPSRPVPSRPVPEEEHVATSGEVDDGAAKPDPNDRDDVHGLLDHLDAKIREVDPEAKLPSRTKANADAARLLIDKDGRTVDQVKAAADYALDSEFWRPNVRSMSKLRDKYDTLRSQAQRDHSRTQSNGQYQTASERRLQAGAERLHRRAQKQAANLDQSLLSITEGKVIE